ncbi:hypothetical protein GSI_04716 [Ganoderma sinense ZZ0214-1]|uniref:Uncharacterized protein n=1 Tax=Ganoderma sinense ZZ0214-1 TaxID=1077348 RepID=A0A2G8SHM0_9APHY|nr:hypothetical protein GSI_04716 [Ganoderma sinense ZZ0214-1]
MSSPSGQPVPATPPPAPTIPAQPTTPSSQRRDAPLPPIPTQEPASPSEIGGPATDKQGSAESESAPAGATSVGTSTATSSSAPASTESTTPVGTPPTAPSVPVPAAPSPSKPVAGKKHLVRRRDDFVNAKSKKIALGSSAQPLQLKNTPKKKHGGLIGPVVEKRVAGANEFLYRTWGARRSGSDLEQVAHGQGTSERPTRRLRSPRSPSAPVPPGYPKSPQVAHQQPAVPQQQLMHQQIMPQHALLQQQAMAHQQFFQQQMPQQPPQMYQPYMQVPAPMAYGVPMQTPNQVLGYHGFPHAAPPLNPGPSLWNDYREAHQDDDADQLYSTPRRVRTHHVHYDLDDDDDEGSNYNNGRGEDGNDEGENDEEENRMEYEHQYGQEYDLEDEDLEHCEDEEEPNEEEQLMEEIVQDDEMEDIDEHAPKINQLGEQTPPPDPQQSERPRPVPQNSHEETSGTSDHIRQQSLSQGPNDDRVRTSGRKGKERATGSSTAGPSTTGSSTLRGGRVLPSQGGESYFLLLLQQFSEFNEHQRKESRLNRQWQQNMMQYVKKLDHKIAHGSAAATHGTSGRSSVSRVKVNRDRPSNSMASRIVLEPRDQPMSPEDLKRLEEKEKGHLADLQNVVRVHFKKLLGVPSYKEMAKKNPPLNNNKVFEYEASGPQYFTADNFRVDFVKPWKEFPFNLSAHDFFASHLVRVLKGGGYKKAAVPARYHTYDHVAEALDVHMDHARRRYREAVSPPDTDEIEKEKRKARMVSRRGTLYTSRFRVTKHVEKYKRFEDIFVNLRGAHMSADETDRDENDKKKYPVTFSIIRAAWMSFAFRRLCRELDKEHIKNRGVLIGDQGSGGSGPRVREDTTPAQEADTRAPVGLWRDCYDSAWLAGLKNDQIRRLNIIDEDFGLALPQSDDEEEDEEM